VLQASSKLSYNRYTTNSPTTHSRCVDLYLGSYNLASDGKCTAAQQQVRTAWREYLIAPRSSSCKQRAHLPAVRCARGCSCTSPAVPTSSSSSNTASTSRIYFGTRGSPGHHPSSPETNINTGATAEGARGMWRSEYHSMEISVRYSEDMSLRRFWE